MDVKSKLGPAWIPDDPHEMSKNGEVLAEILKKHALTVVNGSRDKCIGVITRERNTVDGRHEKSAIDVVIVSNDLLPFVTHMKIDEKREDVLFKNKESKDGTIRIEADHNVIETEMNIKWTKEQQPTVELHNLKNVEKRKAFKEKTTNTSMRFIFDDKKKHLNTLTKMFLKRLNSHVSQCFNKIRITNDKRNKEIDSLFDKRRKLMKDEDNEENKTKLEHIDNELAEKCGNKIYEGIQEEVQGIENYGGYNPGHLWKLRKKLRPKITRSTCCNERYPRKFGDCCQRSQ